jgi:hypothetical protein
MSTKLAPSESPPLQDRSGGVVYKVGWLDGTPFIVIGDVKWIGVSPNTGRPYKELRRFTYWRDELLRSDGAGRTTPEAAVEHEIIETMEDVSYERVMRDVREGRGYRPINLKYVLRRINALQRLLKKIKKRNHNKRGEER